MSAAFSINDASGFAEALDERPALEVLEWASHTFGDRLTIASSFGAEDVVLIDLASRLERPIRVFTLDTGRLHAETYETIERVRNRYGVAIEVYFPVAEEVEALTEGHGPNPFYHSVELRKRCCGIRKLEPLRRALADVDAWVTGLRRDQNVTRTATRAVELDIANGGILKVNPLVAWSNDDIWDYILENDVPYNPLHDQGFASIGCEPCTRAIETGEHERAGRWWWESRDQAECGLHPTRIDGDAT